MKWGDDLPARHDLSSLKSSAPSASPSTPKRGCGTTKHIGRERCPIVDTYWQTETGGHIGTPLPGAIPTKPGSCTLPMLRHRRRDRQRAGPGTRAEQGGPVRHPQALARHAPRRLRQPRALHQQLLGTREGPASPAPLYFSADGARRDEDGYFWIQGRIDDVIKVSGHLLGTMEVESALVSHPAVAEAAVVGVPHEIKGNAICAFVTLQARTG
jgi:acetyl-CoA synthetase